MRISSYSNFDSPSSFHSRTRKNYSEPRRRVPISKFKLKTRDELCQNIRFVIPRFYKSQNSLPYVRVERACTRLSEIRPSNEVRIKLNENSELDKNGYRYVLANNAVYKFKSAQAGKAKGFLLLFCNFFLSKRKKLVKKA